MYKQKFKQVESTLRPRNKFTHEEAIGLLTTVVEDADDRIEELEIENMFYRNYLLISAAMIVLLGLTHFL